MKNNIGQNKINSKHTSYTTRQASCPYCVSHSNYGQAILSVKHNRRRIAALWRRLRYNVAPGTRGADKRPDKTCVQFLIGIRDGKHLSRVAV